MCVCKCIFFLLKQKSVVQCIRLFQCLYLNIMLHQHVLLGKVFLTRYANFFAIFFGSQMFSRLRKEFRKCFFEPPARALNGPIKSVPSVSSQRQLSSRSELLVRSHFSLGVWLQGFLSFCTQS